MKALNRTTIAKRYGITYSCAHAWANEPTFPKPIGRRGHYKAVVWSANEVHDWIVAHKPNNKIVRGVKPTTHKAKVVKPVIVPNGAPSTTALDVILFLLRDDKAKQRLVLDLLLD